MTIQKQGTVKVSNRLRSNEDFQRVRREGRSWAHPLLVVRAARNDLGYSRFGFSVSKAVGKATVRNRVRRRLRELMRLRRTRIIPGWDIVLIARAAIAQSTFGEIAGAVEQLLCQARLFMTGEESR